VLDARAKGADPFLNHGAVDGQRQRRFDCQLHLHRPGEQPICKLLSYGVTAGESRMHLGTVGKPAGKRSYRPLTLSVRLAPEGVFR
jgi:hypothetical protein